MEKMLHTDVLVFATPIYCYEMSGQMKTIVAYNYGAKKPREFTRAADGRCFILLYFTVYFS